MERKGLKNRRGWRRSRSLLLVEISSSLLENSLNNLVVHGCYASATRDDLGAIESERRFETMPDDDSDDPKGGSTEQFSLWRSEKREKKKKNLEWKWWNSGEQINWRKTKSEINFSFALLAFSLLFLSFAFYCFSGNTLLASMKSPALFFPVRLNSPRTQITQLPKKNTKLYCNWN